MARPGGPAGMSTPEHLVWVGLGNPEKDYAGTRHNIGACAVRDLAQKWSASARRELADCDVREIDLPRRARITFACPNSFMNESGGPVARLLKKLDLQPSSLLVFHDELDLDPGTVKLKAGGGSAGHNGVQSLCDALGTQEFARLRIGIGRPTRRGRDYVLDALTPEQRGLIESALGRIEPLLKLYAQGEQSRAVAEINRREPS